MNGNELKRFIAGSRFSDPDYGEDVTAGVQDSLRRVYPANLVDAADGKRIGEIVRVSVSYTTKRGNRKNPTKYAFFSELPESDEGMFQVVRDFFNRVYAQLAKEKPYRAVHGVEILSAERYATVRS